jgi:polyisoprenyl-teichoic acid--peptidoglycan teichoic acid transferase
VISMAQSPRRIPINQKTAPKRPRQDVAAAKNASQFPTVGMTLRSYQYDSRDKSRRPLGKQTVVKRGFWQRIREKWTLKRSVIVSLLIVLVLGGWVGGKFLYNAHRLFGGNIFGILSSTKLKGEDQGRVNILLAGNSADDVGHNGAELTDSIMLISIDTNKNKAFMLSIPRDLWVQIPDDGHAKINSVYVVGKANEFKESGYPEGGMGQLEQVVSEAFDMPIHYYALVNYNALRQAVDAVGGVDLTVRSEDPRGLYDPNIDWTTRGPLVKLTNGRHHLNGRQALNLARARGDAYNSYGFAQSDFVRTEHQRQLIVALKNKAVSAGTLSNPSKLTSLFDAIGGNVKTDIQVDEIRRLYDLMKKIDSSNIKSLGLNDANGKSLLASYASPQGQSALIPTAGVDDYSEIQGFLRRQTSSNPVVQEAAKIVVLNGTTTTGLASKVRKQLTAKRYVVTDVGDAGNTAQAKTIIIDTTNGRKPATKAALKKYFNNAQTTTQNPYANLYNADFIIVVGTDQIQNNNGTATE